MDVQNRQIAFSAARLQGMLQARADHANLVSTVALFATLVLFGLLLLSGYFFIYRRTISGIAALRAGTDIVGQGNLGYVIPGERRDEIGDLSRAFNAMTTDLRSVTASKAELEKEMAARKQAQAERERLFSRQEELSRSLATANEELQTQNEELAAREEELAAQNEELAAQDEELLASNEWLLEAHEQTEHLLAERNSLYARLQGAFVHVPQEMSGVRFGHLYRSATEQAQVGGDFYDVFEAKEGRIGLLIGDVCGHGLEAARLATLVKDTIHAFAHLFRRPSLVLRETNRLLAQKRLPGFVSVFVGFLDSESGRLTYSSAGHPPPLLISQGGLPELLTSRSYPLGVFPDARYRDCDVVVARGSTLLLYTDGITEARRNGALFGEDRLSEAVGRLSSRPVDQLPSLLLSEALDFSGGTLVDDVALLAVNYLGPKKVPGGGEVSCSHHISGHTP